MQFATSYSLENPKQQRDRQMQLALLCLVKFNTIMAYGINEILSASNFKLIQKFLVNKDNMTRCYVKCIGTFSRELINHHFTS